ncbi:MAG: diguanylate cyclase [Gammaproteobacteria bacterium]|nr:diguanylate cyclase [Gammaproteobacteria bacterium]
MSVSSLDHINLRATRELLDQLRDFYCDVVGLTLGRRPPFKEHGYWLYAGDKAVVHLSQSDGEEIRTFGSVTTFGHAAFACSGRIAYEQRLSESGVKYDVAVVPEFGITQLFFQDPAGNGVELSFDSKET